MTTQLDETPVCPSTVPSQQLRTTTAAMRLSFMWFGVHKSLTATQKAEVGETFAADAEVLSAGQRLINTKHVKYKAVNSIRSRAVSLWKATSLPFPEPGIRLVKQDDVVWLNRQMETLQGELCDAVSALDAVYAELKSVACRRLGRLYCELDYPATLSGLFDIRWDWPSVDPPPYLWQLSPAMYRQQCQRVQARFDEAVRLAEVAFLEELHLLAAHLVERLTGNADSRPKVFRDSAVNNLIEFFERFKQLNVHSNEDLDRLVDQCQDIVRGVEPQLLRDNQGLRQHVAAELGQVERLLDTLRVDRRRNILRRPK